MCCALFLPFTCFVAGTRAVVDIWSRATGLMAARRQDGRNQSGIAAPTGGRVGSWAQGPARSWWVGFMSLYTWARIVPRVRCMEACVGEMDTDIKPLAQRNSL